jgi:hypothetical protein
MWEAGKKTQTMRSLDGKTCWPAAVIFATVVEPKFQCDQVGGSCKSPQRRLSAQRRRDQPIRTSGTYLQRENQDPTYKNQECVDFFPILLTHLFILAFQLGKRCQPRRCLVKSLALILFLAGVLAALLSLSALRSGPQESASFLLRDSS